MIFGVEGVLVKNPVSHRAAVSRNPRGMAKVHCFEAPRMPQLIPSFYVCSANGVHARKSSPGDQRIRT